MNSSQITVSVPSGLLAGTYAFKVRNNNDGKESGTLFVTATAPITTTQPSGENLASILFSMKSQLDEIQRLLDLLLR